MQKDCAVTPDNEIDPLNPWCGCGQKIGLPLTSKCRSCGKHCIAYEVLSEDSPQRIYLVRECYNPDCVKTPGMPRRTSAIISSDARYYWMKKDGQACCAGGECKPSLLGTNAVNASQLHTCTLLIEIVKGCNLSCPTCYADSPQTKLEHVEPIPFVRLKEMISSRIEKQGKIDIIQLSGGEPTLHPEFFEIVEWLGQQEMIDDILLNTNGLKLNDPAFLKHLDTVAPKGRFSLYLQYDGLQLEGQIELRAGDFREVRERAIEAVTKIGIPVCLTSVVSWENLPHISQTIQHALTNPLIKWVTLQPEFIVGRNDPKKLLEKPVTVADIINSVEKHSNGLMTGKSFMPLPCSHPSCGTIGFLVNIGGAWRSVSDLGIDLNPYINIIKDRMNIDAEDIVMSGVGCGCDDFNLGTILTQFGIGKDDLKMIFIKPFMDIRTWNEDRIAACCTHVMTEDGKIDSFCRHYANKSSAVFGGFV